MCVYEDLHGKKWLYTYGAILKLKKSAAILSLVIKIINHNLASRAGCVEMKPPVFTQLFNCQVQLTVDPDQRSRPSGGQVFD